MGKTWKGIGIGSQKPASGIQFVHLVRLVLISDITGKHEVYLRLRREKMEEEATKSKLSSQSSLGSRRVISWAGGLVVWITTSPVATNLIKVSCACDIVGGVWKNAFCIASNPSFLAVHCQSRSQSV